MLKEDGPAMGFSKFPFESQNGPLWPGGKTLGLRMTGVQFPHSFLTDVFFATTITQLLKNNTFYYILKIITI